jgi:hypothetical protein
MPQFAFRATDRMGNSVEGKVTAANPAFAANEIGKMGYALVSLEPVSEQAVPDVLSGLSAVPPLNATQEMAPSPPLDSRPAPIDLSQPFGESSTGGTGVAVASGDENRIGAEVTVSMARPEPWERGGPVPQVPAPAIKMNVAGLPVAQTQPVPAMQGAYGGPSRAEAPRGEGETVRPVYYPVLSQNRSFWQRFKEVMIYPLVSGVVVKDLAPYYRQFATLINAGLPLYQTLVALESNTQNAKLKEITQVAQRRVQEGGRFSEVMRL